MKKILYLAKNRSRIELAGILAAELNKLGELTIRENCFELTIKQTIELIRGTNILLTIWDSVPVPREIADDSGLLEYICHVSGTVKPYVPVEIIDAGIPVTNWGDAPANGVAEGAVTLLLAVMKNLHAHIDNVRTDGWKLEHRKNPSASLEGLRLGIYGFGVIGRRFAEMIRPFQPIISIFDPFTDEIPDYCTRVNSLEELFSGSEAVVVHAALTEATIGSVDARLLALLPDHGMIINTARGGIIDQRALFAELDSGRLRAGLDVLDGHDRLDEGHSARCWNNVIFTSHQVSHVSWPYRPDETTRMDEICLTNIKRFINGEPLLHLMDKTRYMLST